jgi:hypothetical protein
MRQHKWSFVGISRGEAHPGVVAVCSECGLIRVETVVLGGNEGKIGLGGPCPGRPAVDKTAHSL